MFDYGVNLMKNAFVRSLFVVGMIGSSQAFAWGAKGHTTVNRIAISMVANPEAKRFLDANSQQIIAFAKIPDIKWKNGASAEAEKPMHWFQMDGYNGNRFGDALADFMLGKAQTELGTDFIKKNGLAMWRVSDFYVQLVEALRAGNFKRAVQVAGVMGHYVGDMTQPMHASSDYDGQSMNSPGVHKYYETTLVDRLDDAHLFSSVQRSAGERRSGLERSIGSELDNAELQHVSWSDAGDAFNALETVYSHMKPGQSDDQWLEADLTPRIGRASALLGKIWDVAFLTAGTQNLPTANVGAVDPEWTPIGQR
jgi:S1/P1 Nuclease